MTTNITVKKVTQSEADRYSEILSNEEAARANSYIQKSDTLRSIVAHGLKRELISRELRCDPKEILFSIGAYGKPRCIKKNAIKFNISHSGDYVAIGTSRDHEIGIDIEFFKNKNYHSISKFALTPYEYRKYKSIGYDKNYLLKIWVTKESLTKTNGTGLHTDFRNIYIKEDSNNKFSSSALVDDKYYFSTLFNYKDGFFSVSSNEKLSKIRTNYL